MHIQVIYYNTTLGIYCINNIYGGLPPCGNSRIAGNIISTTYPESNLKMNLDLKPNPVHSSVAINYTLQSGKNGEITIFNTSNVLIKKIRIFNEQGSLLEYFDELPNGIYLIRLNDQAGNSIVKKMVVTH